MKTNSQDRKVDWVGKQRVKGNVYKKDLENKIGLKQTHPRCMPINKEVLRGQHYRGKLSYLFQEIAQVGASLKHLYATAWHTQNKQLEASGMP